MACRALHTGCHSKKHQEHVRMQLTSSGILGTLTFVQDPASVLPAELVRYLPAGQLVHATAYWPEYVPTGHCAYTSVWLVSTCWNLSTTCNLLYIADLCDVLWMLCPKLKTHRLMELWNVRMPHTVYVISWCHGTKIACVHIWHTYGGICSGLSSRMAYMYIYTCIYIYIYTYIYTHMWSIATCRRLKGLLTAFKSF